ncbi:MAG TPA: PQQ-dependent sugar dehydrogenase [Propionibacteriaceae bacterium]|nr:PQQ-dependent sugar dehydrogenase [Propionibacteriaceae bacterium]
MTSRYLIGLALSATLAVAGCSGADPASVNSPTRAASTQLTTDSSAPTSASASTPRPSGTPTAAKEVAPAGNPSVVVTGLRAPWSVALLGETALISERDDGRILEVLPTGTTRLVGTVEGVTHRGESGLLGLAVDDQDALYAYSTGPNGNRIQRYELTGRPGSLGLGTVTTILDGLPSARTHNGGRIAFGPDGMLYATVGDAGRPEKAQEVGVLAGKILRMTPDGGVPAGNPFPGSLVYSYGHRNPQGIAWAADGTMFASEFGQNTWDELNIITPGANYGWPVVEGVERDARFVDPVQQWNPGQASPSGIAIVGGTIFIANLRGRVLRAVPVASPSTSVEFYHDEFGRIRAVEVSPEGDLWFLTNNTDGRGQPSADDDRLMGVPLAG